MIFDDFKSHVANIGLLTEDLDTGGQPFLTLKDFTIRGGSHDGEQCEVAIRYSDQNPWLPEAQIHVRPHLTEMGQNASQPSPLGQDWQYLSRRFDTPSTPHTYYAFLLTALGEL